FADPRADYRAHQTEIDAAIARVLTRNRYILGPEVAAFENEWAAYLGVAYAIGVGNGTDALELALRALRIGAGEVVVTTSNTAVATVAAIELAGATPLLVDVDEETLTMSPALLREALAQDRERKIKAVIPVHLYGQPADMPTLMALAAEHGARVIEDCAQAHGAAVGGRKVGTFGDAAAFSFYPTKNLGAIGDGGAVVTNDHLLGNVLRLLRSYGWGERYISEEPGMNTRLDELQAAILRVKLPHLDAANERRREIARQYDDSLGKLARLRLPKPAPEARHVYHQYVIRVREGSRDDLRTQLGEIPTAVLYPLPIHLQPAYKNRVAIFDQLPVTEAAAQTLLCLPIHPSMTDAEVARVAAAIAHWHG
ncbi:MAG: DegT/DnrJ/EryC1/StrS family aminotransferase, partial [Verrucomicrobiota bacterium]|nr:DegT/DnrJ/EryC1/StrS family aminotransferase [Verrucomicrobiota bacterium]